MFPCLKPPSPAHWLLHALRIKSKLYFMAYKMLLDLVPVHFSKLIEHPQWLSLSSLHMPRLFPAFVLIFSA